MKSDTTNITPARRFSVTDVGECLKDDVSGDIRPHCAPCLLWCPSVCSDNRSFHCGLWDEKPWPSRALVCLTLNYTWSDPGSDVYSDYMAELQLWAVIRPAVPLRATGVMKDHLMRIWRNFNAPDERIYPAYQAVPAFKISVHALLQKTPKSIVQVGGNRYLRLMDTENCGWWAQRAEIHIDTDITGQWAPRGARGGHRLLWQPTPC